MSGLFVDLKAEEKVNFFVHCQKLLTENHPNSPFICRAGNIKIRLAHMKGFVTSYKGLCYQDENVCALYNKIVLTNPTEPELAVRDHMYKAPSEHYNAMVVDFVVFREIKDCSKFVQLEYNANIQHVLFVRHNKVKVYQTIDFLKQILNIPVM